MERTQKTIMDLQRIRQSQSLTQPDVAYLMRVSLPQVSRFEHCRDAKMSMLRKYVEALGGRLTVVAEFPGLSPVEIVSDQPRGIP